MSLHRLRLTIITLGFTAPIAVLGTCLVLGVPVTPGQSLSWLLAGLVPAVVMLAVFRGAPPRTIGQVLYDTDQASPGMRPVLIASGRAVETEMATKPHDAN